MNDSNYICNPILQNKFNVYNKKSGFEIPKDFYTNTTKTEVLLAEIAREQKDIPQIIPKLYSLN